MQTGSLIIEVFHILEKHVRVAYDKTSAEGVLGLGHGTSVWLYVFMCISRYFPASTYDVTVLAKYELIGSCQDVASFNI